MLVWIRRFHYLALGHRSFTGLSSLRWLCCLANEAQKPQLNPGSITTMSLNSFWSHFPEVSFPLGVPCWWLRNHLTQYCHIKPMDLSTPVTSGPGNDFVNLLSLFFSMCGMLLQVHCVLVKALIVSVEVGLCQEGFTFGYGFTGAINLVDYSMWMIGNPSAILCQMTSSVEWDRPLCSAHPSHTGLGPFCRQLEQLCP